MRNTTQFRGLRSTTWRAKTATWCHSKEQLEAAPADSLDMLTRNDGAASYATRANEYYKVS